MTRTRTAILTDREHPLVSVIVFNHNYGRFLKECIESILNQTYPNIEICFSDNASTDESWEIAQAYQREYPGIFNIARNRQNFGAHGNIVNAAFGKVGKYHVLMCSDDAMAPGFVEKSVKVLEANPNCAYAMVHRAIMDEDGHTRCEPPFYNQSCIIEGSEQARVYMMAAVNPSVSQIMYVSYKTAAYGANVSRQLAGRWYGTRLLDFELCCNYPVAYIKEALLLHRLHGMNDSLKAAGNLLEVIGPFVLHHQFVQIAQSYNLTRVAERLTEATAKISELCLRYCIRFLANGDERTARQYHHLSVALWPEISERRVFKKMQGYWEGRATEKKGIMEELEKETNLLAREVSYDPPEGSLPIEGL